MRLRIEERNPDSGIGGQGRPDDSPQFLAVLRFPSSVLPLPDLGSWTVLLLTLNPHLSTLNHDFDSGLFSCRRAEGAEGPEYHIFAPRFVEFKTGGLGELHKECRFIRLPRSRRTFPIKLRLRLSHPSRARCSEEPTSDRRRQDLAFESIRSRRYRRYLSKFEFSGGRRMARRRRGTDFNQWGAPAFPRPARRSPAIGVHQPC